MNWTARVLLHVGATAFLQLPGGLVAVNDEQQALQDGDNVQVDVVAESQVGAVQDANLHKVGPFRVRQNGQAALLINAQAMLPLLLRSSERLPEQVYLLIHTESAEQTEGATPPPTAPTRTGGWLPTAKDLDSCACPCPHIPPLEIYLGYLAQRAGQAA